jgi:hypothetical protein
MQIPAESAQTSYHDNNDEKDMDGAASVGRISRAFLHLEVDVFISHVVIQ